MNDLPVPRFRIGQAVWYCQVVQSSKTLTCPDCLGTKRWRLILPCGDEHDVDCRTCGWLLPTGVIHEPIADGHVECLTIGSVRIETDRREPRERVSYMCHETGVGSGRVYYENHLYESESEAKGALPGLVAKRTEEIATRWEREVENRRKDPGGVVAMYRKERRQLRTQLSKIEKKLERFKVEP